MGILIEKSCKAYKRGDPPLSMENANQLLQQLDDWTLSQESQSIQRKFGFKNFYETMAFVNAAAWIAHKEDHHGKSENEFRAHL